MLDELAQATGVTDDQRRPGGRRLEGHQPERLVDRRHDGDVGGGGKRGELVRWDPAEERHRPTEPKPSGVGTQVGTLRPFSRDHQAQPGVPAAQPGQRVEQGVAALLPLQPSGEDEQRSVGGVRRPRGRDDLVGATDQRSRSMPLGITSTESGGRSKSRVTSQRMCDEQVMTRRASKVSHHSTVCTALLSGPGSQPWCRPASVAWTVATSGMP